MVKNFSPKCIYDDLRIYGGRKQINQHIYATLGTITYVHLDIMESYHEHY